MGTLHVCNDLLKFRDGAVSLEHVAAKADDCHVARDVPIVIVNAVDRRRARGPAVLKIQFIAAARTFQGWGSVDSIEALSMGLNTNSLGAVLGVRGEDSQAIPGAC